MARASFGEPLSKAALGGTKNMKGKMTIQKTEKVNTDAPPITGTKETLVGVGQLLHI